MCLIYNIVNQILKNFIAIMENFAFFWILRYMCKVLLKSESVRVSRVLFDRIKLIISLEINISLSDVL